MQKEEIDRFKQQLLALKGQITRIMDGQDNQNLTRDAVDEVDQATDMMANMMGSAISSNYHNNLVKIQEALKRIENNEFGKCMSCGTEIPIGRLEILPFTLYCMDCQKEIERTRRNRR